MPLKAVAAHYDSEYWRVRNACKQSSIPLPPSGYWAKAESGKKLPPRPALPPTAQTRVALYTGHASAMEDAAKRRQTKVQHKARLNNQLQKAAARDHPVVAEIRRRREQGYSVANPRQREIHMAPLSEAGKRSFQLMNMIATALSLERVKLEATGIGFIGVNTAGWQVQVRAREKLRQIRTKIKKSSPPSIWDQFRGDWAVSYEPTGLVECEVDSARWIDKPGRPVEQMVPDIVAEIFCRIGDLSRQEAKRQQSAALRDLAMREKERATEASHRERETWNNLVELATAFETAGKVRAFLRYLETLPFEASDLDGASKAQWIARLSDLLEKNDPATLEPSEIAERFDRGMS